MTHRMATDAQVCSCDSLVPGSLSRDANARRSPSFGSYSIRDLLIEADPVNVMKHNSEVRGVAMASVAFNQ
jgi:hypothetical protein